MPERVVGNPPAQGFPSAFKLLSSLFGAAIHYNRQLCFALRFLTHADYSKDRWKTEL